MKPALAACCLLLTALPGRAAEGWDFDSPLALDAGPTAGVFHHLEGAGRKHIAVANGVVAAVWEDNRSRSPRVYVARKDPAQAAFSEPLPVSGGAEAYEPSIAALPRARFAIAWEQDGGVFLRLLEDDGLGPVLTLADAGAGHVSLAAYGERVYAAWREQRERRWYLRVASLEVNAAGAVEVLRRTAVEADGVETELLLPALAASKSGLCIAWEDRRAGHTRLLVAHSGERAVSFAAPQHLNEFYSNRNQYDRGSGVTRVSLAAFAEDEILAAWMDKRRGGLGYGIFAALGSDGGKVFGPDEKVHGQQGDRQPHHNPATAGNARGALVVAWDDFRRGDSDVWLSYYDENDEWSEDLAPAPASGAGEQSHPAIALDDAGRLHLLWLERAAPDAPTRLWYSLGLPRRSGAQ